MSVGAFSSPTDTKIPHPHLILPVFEVGGLFVCVQKMDCKSDLIEKFWEKLCLFWLSSKKDLFIAQNMIK